MADGPQDSSPEHSSRRTRVVVIGSESTGKTTLAGELATHYGAPLAGEFVRRYADAKHAPLEAADVEPIARGQLAAEDDISGRADGSDSELVILDTDLNSTVVYARHYYGTCPAWIEEAARVRRGDLYLLLDIDVPWIADPQRDRGDRRPEMHALFHARLSEIGARHAVIRGSWAQRFALATTAIDDLIRQRSASATHRPRRPD
jgi:NadR type nicotinamide-nucleotide adenylyltransferase